MRVLGVDSATRTVSVGIVEDEEVRAQRSLSMSRQHGATLVPLIEETLRDAGLSLGDLDGVAVSIGPGSFTGLRVGLSVAKGLAFAAGKPLVGVSTLEAFAHAARPRAPLVWPVLDARRGELYAAAFEYDGAALRCRREAATVSVGWFLEQVALPCRLVGDGADACREALRERLGAEEDWLSSALDVGVAVGRLGAVRLAVAGGDDPTHLEPHYAQLCDAERRRYASI